MNQGVMVATAEGLGTEIASVSDNGRQSPVVVYREVYKHLADRCRDEARRPAMVDEIWSRYDARLAQLDGATAEPVIISALDGLSESVRDILNGGAASEEDRLEWLDLYPRNVLMLLEPRSETVSFADPDDDDDDEVDHRSEDAELDD